MYKYIKLTLTCKLTSSQVKIQTNTQNLFIFYSIIKVITLSKRNSYGFGYVGHSFFLKCPYAYLGQTFLVKISYMYVMILLSSVTKSCELCLSEFIFLKQSNSNST